LSIKYAPGSVGVLAAKTGRKKADIVRLKLDEALSDVGK
jgi:hypothetical protein